MDTDRLDFKSERRSKPVRYMYNDMYRYMYIVSGSRSRIFRLPGALIGQAPPYLVDDFWGLADIRRGVSSLPRLKRLKPGTWYSAT